MFLSDSMLHMHQQWMLQALHEANKALEIGEVPVGAIAVMHNKIIARAYNQRENLNDPTAHAEILALRQAAQAIGGWRLTEVTLYVTLEPCPMCAGAIVQSRLGGLIFGAFDVKGGAVGSIVDMIRNPLFKNQTEVLGGILAQECQDVLRSFFIAKRH